MLIYQCDKRYTAKDKALSHLLEKTIADQTAVINENTQTGHELARTMDKLSAIIEVLVNTHRS
jgi:hypothetical protein